MTTPSIELTRINIERAIQRLEWAKDWLEIAPDDKNEQKQRLDMAKEWIDRAIVWSNVSEICSK